MSSALQTDPEAEFFASQLLAPQERDSRFETLYFRQLQTVTNRIHETDNVEQIMLEVSQDICRLFNAERLTLYAISDDRSSLVSKVKTGLNTSQDLKLPIGAQSIAGYVALEKKSLNLKDVYDATALADIHPELSFLQEVDKRSGYRTKQMLVAPLIDGGMLYGVLQVINNLSDQPFAKLEEEGAQHLCKTLAIAIRQRLQKTDQAARRKATKYDALVSEALLLQDELSGCIRKARDQSQSVEHLLMADYGIRAAQIGFSLARFFGVQYEAFRAGRVRSEWLNSSLKREFLEQQGWVPLDEAAGSLLIMCTDPEATQGSRVVQQVFPRVSRFSYRVTTQTEFGETLNQMFGVGKQSVSIDQMLADMDSTLEDSAGDDASLESAASDNELVKFVNKMIVDAHHQKASDIHIEPMPGKAKTGIRFRIDGSLQSYVEVPAQFRQPMVTRLKIMCDLDISEKRKPQDGKIKFKKYGPIDIELRVATIPSAGGVEDVVMRILAAGEPIPLEQLGFTQHNLEQLEKTVSKPHGLFYVCGPTGSGKTTTLHSILKFLNTPDTKIWTAEDPVEITQKGLRQVQINKKAGIDFAVVMRAFLRADPDIIMVGESRDKETVSMGVEASLTGHMVFSTLHTNSAPESITRLLDMGMEPFNFADALLGILAQRLAKKLCDCKQSYYPAAEEIRSFVTEYSDELRHLPDWQSNPAAEAKKLYESWVALYGHSGKLTMHRAIGCDSCKGTGYKGRVGLHELMIIDEAMKKLIQERGKVKDMFSTAVLSGMRTLKMDGMQKALMGVTDLKMVRAVCLR